MASTELRGGLISPELEARELGHRGAEEVPIREQVSRRGPSRSLGEQPIGIAGALAAVAVFPRIRPTSRPRLDVWGFVTAGYGLFALLLAFSDREDWGWSGWSCWRSP